MGSLLENANRFMGKSVYEQAELEAKAKLSEMEDEEVPAIDTEEEVGDDVEAVDVDVDVDVEGEEEEEVPVLPVEAAIRAIQLALNGEVESAEEALDMVQDMEAEAGEDEELEASEEEEEEVEEEVTLDDTPDVDDKPIKDLPDDFKELGEGEEEAEEEVVEEEEVAEEAEPVAEETVEEEAKEENVYGENHSRFLKLSERYL